MCCCACKASGDGGGCILVEQGQARASILLRVEATEREIGAAEEIRRCVRESTGVSLPVVSMPEIPRGYVIKLGLKEPGPGESTERFLVSASDSGSDIVGFSPLAVYYGACAFLEEAVGVRWYLPGPLGEIIPKRRCWWGPTTYTTGRLRTRQSKRTRC